MSDSKFPTKKEDNLPAEPLTDLTEHDMKLLRQYVEDGLPGIGILTEDLLDRAQRSYFNGNIYTNVARAMMVKKEIILYAAHKFNWYLAKKTHIEELESKSLQNLSDALIRVKGGFTRLVLHNNQVMEDRLNYFERTSDSKTKEEIDSDTLKYAKLVDQLAGMNKEARENFPKPSPIGINIGSGIKVTDNNTGRTMDITPRKESMGAAIERMAEEERQEEKRKKNEKIVDLSDIKEENE
jgi:hypothetical protein